jgi:hypothetical protein
MTPRKTKRAATLAVVASCFLLCIAGTSAAQSEDIEATAAGEESLGTEGIGEKKPRLNSVRLSGLYAHQFLNERNSAATGEPLEIQENFGGFEIAYQRDLIEDHLAIELSKPFLFSEDTFESPFEVTLQGLFMKGPWEGYIGAIVAFNIRVFNAERAQEEGQKNIVSFGVGATIGGTYHFTERWGLELGFDYVYVPPIDPVVAHDIDVALGGVYYF